MIKFRKGDIFASGARALVNPVNCLGVSGAGLAKAFAERYPTACEEYAVRARAGQVKPGHVLIVTAWYMDEKEMSSRWIVFLPTKKDWRQPSELDLVRSGLADLVEQIPYFKLPSIAIPALGCGLGRLDWNIVRPIVHAAAKQMEKYGTDVYIYEPS